MKIVTIATACALTFMLSGCFESEAPKCSDPAVKGLVKNLYQNSVKELSNNPMTAIFIAALPKEIRSFSAVRPVAYDEKVKLRSCKAEAHFDGNVTANIEYTVQLSEENPEEFYVELDTAFMEGLVQQSMMQGIFEQ
jgi:hypothetical protein